MFKENVLFSKTILPLCAIAKEKISFLFIKFPPVLSYQHETILVFLSKVCFLAF